MSARTFDRVRPDDNNAAKDMKDRGWRLHVFREWGDLTWLAEEQVLPEKVADPRAQRIIASRRIELTEDELVWLHAQLTDLLVTSRVCRCGHPELVHGHKLIPPLQTHGCWCECAAFDLDAARSAPAAKEEP